ncbi:MAG: hypothetical protein KBT11_03675 [Treponema sp.]|nr:hypothetical protein [Candidatus Treponema equifaecale]
MNENTAKDLKTAMTFSSNKPIFSKERDLRKIGRGNPLLSRKRIRTIEEVEASLLRIFGKK